MEKHGDTPWWDRASDSSCVTAELPVVEVVDIGAEETILAPPPKNTGVVYWTREELFPGIRDKVVANFTMCTGFKGMFLLDASVPCSEADLSEVAELASICRLNAGIEAQDIDTWLQAYPTCEHAVEVLATHKIVFAYRYVRDWFDLAYPKIGIYGFTKQRTRLSGRLDRLGLGKYTGVTSNYKSPIGLWAHGSWVLVNPAAKYISFSQWIRIFDMCSVPNLESLDSAQGENNEKQI